MFSSFYIAALRTTLRAAALASLKFLLIGSISFIAIWLNLLPLSNIWLMHGPQWPAIIVLIWSICLPSYLSFAVAGLIGLLLDNLCGAKIGTHMLALVSISYLTYCFSLPDEFDRIERISQAGIILLLCMLYQIILWILYQFTHLPVESLFKKLGLSPLLSTIVWFYLVDKIQYVYNVLDPDGELLTALFPKATHDPHE